MNLAPFKTFANWQLDMKAMECSVLMMYYFPKNVIFLRVGNFHVPSNEIERNRWPVQGHRK